MKCVWCESDNLEIINCIGNGVNTEYTVRCLTCGACGPEEKTQVDAVESYSNGVRLMIDRWR